MPVNSRQLMIPFRTVLLPAPAPFDISHRDATLLIGSCFTEHIGDRLLERKFDVSVNPFGIVYNPVSMAHCLERLMDGNRPFEMTDLFEHQGLWHSWAHHGHFSQPLPERALAGINSAYYKAVAALERSKCLFLTLGTADVFLLLENGRIVANNHKMPGGLFTQKRLGIAEITETLAVVLERLRSRQPELRVILTVSPIRHLRAGLVENQRSKAALVLACESLCQNLSYTNYFPAYELVLDDLRDYRFYEPDMVHPNGVAIDYIWQYFSAMFFLKATQGLNERIEKILAAVKHRPFNPETAEHKTFVQKQLEILLELEILQPGLDFSGEKRFLGQFLK